jgi:hypothetical protein
VDFFDAIKKKYYLVGNYDDQYMRWTTLRQERNQMVPEYTNIFHTLHTNLGIRDYEKHLVLKYHNDLHRYIKKDIDLLVDYYQYAIKIKKKFKQKNKWDLSFANPLEKKHGKVALTSKEKDKERMANSRIANPSHQQRRVT